MPGKPPIQRKHGHTDGRKRSPTYSSWQAMLTRCNSPSHSSYANYGARGVRVCARWDPRQGGSFVNFLQDMGERPEGMTLDKDTKGDGLLYSPETCVWATPAQQSRHTRATQLFTYQGKTQCLQDWAKELGLSFAVISYRIGAGWEPDEVVKPATLPRRQLTWKGKTQSVCEWARELKIQSQLIRYRLKQGWTVEEALSTSPRSRRGSEFALSREVLQPDQGLVCASGQRRPLHQYRC